MVWLSRANLAFPLPQFKTIANIRAGDIQNTSYANCRNIVISFEILPAINLTCSSEVHTIGEHR
jgi:hypothetical protein